MSKPAREILTIVKDGRLQAGVSAYGLRANDVSNPADFPHGAWPADTGWQEGSLHGQDWEVIVWDIAPSSWPAHPEWARVVKQTLRALIDAGCIVSWIGSEGYFCDPPDLFKPECMSGGVLAAMTQAGDFDCAVDPYEPLQVLPDEKLLALRAASHGLADAS